MMTMSKTKRPEPCSYAPSSRGDANRVADLEDPSISRTDRSHSSWHLRRRHRPRTLRLSRPTLRCCLSGPNWPMICWSSPLLRYPNAERMGSNVLVFCAELAPALHLERLVPTISSDQRNRALEVVPILVLVVALIVRAEVSPSESVGLLTVCGVMATLLFSAFIQLSQRVKSLVTPEGRSRADANNREFLGEAGSNARCASRGQLFFAVSAGVHGVTVRIPAKLATHSR